MKQITLLRHAKSDWANENLLDIDRPLNNRGYNDAYAQGEWFLKNKQLPNLIYTSTATRALSTSLIFARILNFPSSHFILEPGLYECNTNYLMNFIQKQNQLIQHLLIVGHNPVSTDICNHLLHDGFIDELPTCGLISLQFDCNEWQQVKPNTATIKFYQFPKDKKYN